MVIFRQTSNETERPRDVCVAEYFAAQYYFRFPTCWCHCIQKVKVYQQTNFRRHISIHGWDIITSVLEKTSAILEFYFRFQVWLYHRNRHAIFCIRLPNCIQIGQPTAEIWRHIDFSRWRPRPLNTTSGFSFVDAAVFGRSKSISKPNFVILTQFVAEI